MNYAKLKNVMVTDMQRQTLTAANQNVPILFPLDDQPQWFDVKHLVECMFDARAKVRDAIAERKNAEMVRVHYAGHSSRQLITAEIHGLNMQIALMWHEYRQASEAYHATWATYRKNLNRI